MVWVFQVWEYSYELFNDYGVEKIIRIGTAGSYDANLKVYDVLLADSVYSITNFDIESGKEDLEILNTSAELNSVIMNTARIKGVDLKVGRVHSSEAFYTDNNDYSKYTDLGCKAVEMETYALVYNANRFMKKATALFTISDNLITHDLIDSEARERKLDEMITLALESVIKD